MAILASKSPSAATSAAELLYVVPAGKLATINVLAANRGAAATTIRVWLTKAVNAAGVVDAELIEVDTPLTARGTVGNAMERTALTLGAGDAIYIGGGSLTISFNVHGYEENV